MTVRTGSFGEYLNIGGLSSINFIALARNPTTLVSVFRDQVVGKANLLYDVEESMSVRQERQAASLHLYIPFPLLLARRSPFLNEIPHQRHPRRTTSF